MFFSQAQNRPLNTFPAWKYALVVIALIVGAVYSLPNLYPNDPSIQISPEVNYQLNQEIIDKVRQSLTENNYQHKSIKVETDGSMMLVRFNDIETQIKAKDIISNVLGQGYIVAFNLAPAVPEWLSAINAQPMKLGLDLRGGIHFLLEVDMDVAIEKSEQQYVDDLKRDLREKKIRYSKIERVNTGGLLLRFRSEESRSQASSLISQKHPGLVLIDREQGKFFNIKARISETKRSEIKRYAVEQNTTILRTRVDSLGVAEPYIQRQGEDRIVVQLPGVQDSAKAKDIIGVTASLEFRLVHQSVDMQSVLDGRIPPDGQLFSREDGTPIVLQRSIIAEGKSITSASFGTDENGFPQVNIRLDSKGGSRMTAVSGKNIGKRMAVLFIEYKTEYEKVDGKLQPKDKLLKIEKVISVATIQTTLPSSFVITGIDSVDEAHNLVVRLRAGALIAPLKFVEERTIGPSLGQDNIDKGVMAVKIGMAVVLVFMLFYYRMFGLVANLALVINLVLLVAVMSMFQATLTLPGIAGIVLTVGMAVDANVLIYERIREELRDGSSVQRAIHNGYDRAFVTIMDANITTLIAAVILFAIGTGAIKGFAVTLAIGILTSMFTAIIGSRALVNLMYGGKKLTKLPI